MSIYEFSKDILVPAISPFIAAMALALVVRQERAKLSAQREHTLQAAVKAAERELIMLREAYQLIGLHLVQQQALEPERLDAFDQSTERLLKAFNESPEVYESFFSKRKVRLVMTKMPLLFSELQIKLKQVRSSKSVDNFILFSIYLLLYARKSDRDDGEEASILDSVYATNPSFYSAWWKGKA